MGAKVSLHNIEGCPEFVRKKLNSHGVFFADQLVSLANIHDTHKALRKTLRMSEKQLDDLIGLAGSMLPNESCNFLAPVPIEGHMVCGFYDDKEGAVSSSTPPFKYRSRYLPSEINHIDKLPPVRDQGKRGTCVAFAVVAAREFEEIISPEKLSEQYLYWACKQKDCHPGPGTYLSTAMECLSELGICSEKAWPYNPRNIPGNEGQGPPLPGAEDEAGSYMIEKSHFLLHTDIETLKSILSVGINGTGQLITFGVPVFPSWQNAETDRTGVIVMPFEGEMQLGGHALCLVGYTDDSSAPGGGYFIFRNSWSGRWAVDSPYAPGYGMLPYAYMHKYGRSCFVIERCASDAFMNTPFEEPWKTVLCAVFAGIIFGLGLFWHTHVNIELENTAHADDILSNNKYLIAEKTAGDCNDEIAKKSFEQQYDAIREKLYESYRLLFK